MPRKRELTWHKARRCYRKVYQGRTHYLKTAVRNKSDEIGYRAALLEWQAIKLQIDRATSQANASGATPSEPAEIHAAVFATDYSRHRFKALPVTRRLDGNLTVSDLIDGYLKQREISANAGQLSVKQYGQDRSKLDDFRGFATVYGKPMLSQIDGPFLSAYRMAQQDLTKHPDPNERISAETCRKRLQTVLRLWRWAYKNEYVEQMPRILDPEFASIKIARPQPKFWTIDEIRSLFSAASRRTKLYIGLACNCGYTQREISSLRWDMIDADGKIQRRRPKSGVAQTHILWPWLLTLLRHESKRKSGICLLGAKGNELLSETIREDGKITHNDSIRLAFNRTMKKTKLASTGRTFKSIRKTSANRIFAEFGSKDFVDLFLAHGQRAMRDHYVESHYDGVFNAVAWLDGIYKLSELL